MSAFSLHVLKIHNFRLLTLARLCFLMALQAQAVIVGWQVYSLTKSAWYLGLTGLAEAVPAILCSLFAGHVVDTGHPHKIYTACLGLLTLNTLLLSLLAGGYIPLSTPMLLFVLFSGIFISGLARSFFAPSAFILLSMIVKREDTPSASSWQTTANQIGFIGGPAIGGILYGGYGAGSWLFPLFMMLCAFVLALFMRITDERKKEAQRVSAIKSIGEGWRFLFQNQSLLSLMALDMLGVLFGGAIALLPAFADQILHVGAEGLGALRAAPAIGAVFAALYFSLKPMKHITGFRMFLVVAAFGLCMIGFGLSQTFWFSVFFLTLSGVFDSINMVIRSTLMQLLTPDEMRGRVAAVSTMFVISSNELGAFESGVAATLLGLAPSVVFGGVMTLVVVGATALLCPKFRTLHVTS